MVNHGKLSIKFYKWPFSIANCNSHYQRPDFSHLPTGFLLGLAIKVTSTATRCGNCRVATATIGHWIDRIHSIWMLASGITWRIIRSSHLFDQEFVPYVILHGIGSNLIFAYRKCWLNRPKELGIATDHLILEAFWQSLAKEFVGFQTLHCEVIGPGLFFVPKVTT